MNEKNKKIEAKDHLNFNKFSIICFMLPIVGIIIGIIYLGKDSERDKKLGEHCITFSILILIALGIVLISCPSISFLLS